MKTNGVFTVDNPNTDPKPELAQIIKTALRNKARRLIIQGVFPNLPAHARIKKQSNHQERGQDANANGIPPKRPE